MRSRRHSKSKRRRSRSVHRSNSPCHRHRSDRHHNRHVQSKSPVPRQLRSKRQRSMSRPRSPSLRLSKDSDPSIAVLSRIMQQQGQMHRQYGPQREKPVLGGLRTTQAQTQPAHSRSLISAFVIRILESTISKLAISQISFF